MKYSINLLIFIWLFSLQAGFAHNGSINGQITEVSGGVELAGYRRRSCRRQTDFALAGCLA